MLPPEVIAAGIVEDLQSALTEFAAVAEALGGEAPAGNVPGEGTPAEGAPEPRQQ